MNRNLIAIGLGAAMGVAAWLGCSAPPDTIGGMGAYPGGPTPTGTTTTTAPTGTTTGTTTGTGTNPPPPPPPPGTDGGGSTGPQTPAQYYQTMVDPSLEGTCGGCHATGANNAPRFLGPSAAAAYATIKAFPGLVVAPAQSKLLTQGAHEGPALTANQITLVTTWLNQEVTASPPPPGSGITITQALTMFGQCMSLTDFTKQTNGFSMAGLANLNTANRGPCQSCHDRGTGGFWASSGTYQGTNETTVMFNETQQFPYIEKFATAEVNTDGSYKDIVPSNGIAAVQQQAATCNAAQGGQSTCHPIFTLPQGQLDAINAFLTATQARMTANQCTTGAGPADAGGGG